MQYQQVKGEKMKKKNCFKRLLATCLAAVMIMAVAIPATVSAAEPAPGTSSEVDEGKGKITIDNPIKGKTYYIYKIFDVTYTTVDGKTSYSYSIDTDSAWLDVVQGYANNVDNGLTLTKSAGGDKYVVSSVDGTFSPADFAKHLSENTTGIEPTDTFGPLEGEETVLVKENLPLGYYFVKGSSGALCNLTTTDPAVTIHDKNDVPFTKDVENDENDQTEPEKDGVKVGQILKYKITGKVPDIDGFEEYYYRASDIMDEGLTFMKDVTVTIAGGGVDLTEVTSEADLKGNAIMYIPAGTYTYPAKDGEDPVTKEIGGGFKLSLDLINLKKDYQAEILITYTATVNEKAVSVISENEATLDYGNDPDDLTDSTPQVVRTFSSQIVIDKYKKQADDDTSKKLSGAKFVLKRVTEEGVNQYYKGTFTDVPGTDEEGAATVVKQLTKVEWIDEEEGGELPADITEVETDENGAATFAGVQNGTYYLVETEAPAGYNLLTEDVEVTVEASITGDPPTLENATVTAHIANSNGSFLPSTGGMGTTLFYVFGTVLLMAAVVFFVIRKRMSAKQE